MGPSGVGCESRMGEDVGETEPSCPGRNEMRQSAAAVSALWDGATTEQTAKRAAKNRLIA